LLDRQVAGVGTSENAVDIRGRLPVDGHSIWPVRHQAAVADKVTIWITSWQSLLGRECIAAVDPSGSHVAIDYEDNTKVEVHNRSDLTLAYTPQVVAGMTIPDMPIFGCISGCDFALGFRTGRTPPHCGPCSQQVRTIDTERLQEVGFMAGKIRWLGFY
jgi:hypothetical protein